jgi:cytochrome c nitrite reductase small subunit
LKASFTTVPIMLVSWIKTRSFWVRAILVAMAGAVVGLGTFTFVYADGFSYLGSNPETCANCHVMRDAYEGWNHSSHKTVALCVDCHAPHNVIEKYAVKGINGIKDMVTFTFNIIPEPIHIRPFNQRIVQDQCVYCHRDLVQPMSYENSENPTDCLRCHTRIGHDY